MLMILMCVFWPDLISFDLLLYVTISILFLFFIHELTELKIISGSSSNVTTDLGRVGGEDSLSVSGSTGETFLGSILSKSPSDVIIGVSTSMKSFGGFPPDVGLRGTTSGSISTPYISLGIVQCFPVKSLTPPNIHEVNPTGNFVLIIGVSCLLLLGFFLFVTPDADDVILRPSSETSSGDEADDLYITDFFLGSFPSEKLLLPSFAEGIDDDNDDPPVDDEEDDGDPMTGDIPSGKREEAAGAARGES